MDILTESHKEIYNIYLKYLALKNNRPYQKRKNFDDVTEYSDTYSALVKLDLFFKRNPELNINLYFKLGFESSKDTFLKLDYFLNLHVLKNYNRYIKTRYNTDIDSIPSIEDFKSGLFFIIQFLRENNVKLNDYSIHKNTSGVYSFLIHLKQQKISLYHLHCFNISLSGISLPDEILNIYLDDFRNKFYQTKRSYEYSRILKQIGNKVTEKLKTN